MPVAEYEDFELEIGSDLPVGGGPQQYYGRVVRSPAGEAPKSQVKFWFSAPGELAKLRGELESAVLEIDEKNRQGPTTRGEQVLRDFGRGVFRSVFTDVPSIQRIYERSKGAAQDLRIKLRIESADLAGLPWEYLYDEDDMPGFVSLTRPIVRYLETAGGVGRMGVKGPLRILGMIADPSTSEWPKLNVVKERDRINKGIDALQHEGKVDFQWVPGGTGKDLMKKLLEGEWHIFHFIGHGGVEEALPGAGASGFVDMVDEDGKPVKKFASGDDADGSKAQPAPDRAQLLREREGQCRRSLRQSGDRADEDGMASRRGGDAVSDHRQCRDLDVGRVLRGARRQPPDRRCGDARAQIHPGEVPGRVGNPRPLHALVRRPDLRRRSAAAAGRPARGGVSLEGIAATAPR